MLYIQSTGDWTSDKTYKARIIFSTQILSNNQKGKAACALRELFKFINNVSKYKICLQKPISFI